MYIYIYTYTHTLPLSISLYEGGYGFHFLSQSKQPSTENRGFISPTCGAHSLDAAPRILTWWHHQFPSHCAQINLSSTTHPPPRAPKQIHELWLYVQSVRGVPRPVRSFPDRQGPSDKLAVLLSRSLPTTRLELWLEAWGDTSQGPRYARCRKERAEKWVKKRNFTEYIYIYNHYHYYHYYYYISLLLLYYYHYHHYHYIISVQARSILFLSATLWRYLVQRNGTRMCHCRNRAPRNQLPPAAKPHVTHQQSSRGQDGPREPRETKAILKPSWVPPREANAWKEAQHPDTGVHSPHI